MGIMNASSVTMIKWIPGFEDTFMASFEDGSILILEKDRDDQSFHFQITKPNKFNNKYNPIAHWRVSRKGIVALACFFFLNSFFIFTRNQHLAIVGKDGLLRVIDYINEWLCDVFVGYFGGLLCVTWSPDGHYILTGGQDDLVTIWSFKEKRIVARCQGHKSWVTDVAFDPLYCDDTEYRFASVGEDCKLLLWNFSVNALHKPKQEKAISFGSSSSSISSNSNNNGSSNNTSNEVIAPFTPLTTQHTRLPTIHPLLFKTQVPSLQPIVKQTIHPDPCVDVIFTEDEILTTDRRGRIRSWSRP
ncbi:WD40-repeat-containing domain protein [Cokeromyces recurvatus]|uniref:WD40-repeat-containing domain protein n=1 Tax=Cokeromyces recurvatus TaxID=90255 RepID=UPI002220E296|nr:WD40-repeat-containing domain protein [Cokeromyces recurvatus]KAI7900112.1 WD40-repeat-containing domain protein [Cokeromyces recurvatus]